MNIHFDESKKEERKMQYTAPHYYNQFECIAGDCPDTCCAGWQIAIDKKSLKRYQRQKGAIGNRLHNEIDWKEEIFKQYEGRCAFLNEENLCDLYLEGGSKMFCRTCRMYPRHVEEFEGLKEISLSLSCPVAAELILGCEESVRFLSKETEETGQEEDEDFDFLLFTKLEDARDLIFKILMDRKIAMNVRMAMVLALAHDLQQRIDKNALFEADSLFERYQKEGAVKWFEDRMRKYAEDEMAATKRTQALEEAFRIFDGLEVLREDWKGYQTGIRRTLFEEPSEIWQKLPESYEVKWEQLMVYFVYTYFCGAVYDGNAYGKMKFEILGTLLIREMTRALWIQNDRNEDEKEALFGDLQEAARRYAREIEHSDLNKGIVMERLDSEERFSLDSFLQIISTT